jgi:ligand-binding sensor domain-containing protein
MSIKDYQLDLPVPVGGEDLPIPVADAAPQQEQPRDKAFLEWGNIVSQRHVRHLAFDPIQGDLWLATGGGILHWKLELNRFVRYTSEHGLPGNSVSAVAVDGAGQVWAAHEQFGIYYLKNDTWRPYRILGEVKVSCLTLDSTGKLWAGTASGIYAINTPDRKPFIELPPAGFPPRAMAIAKRCCVGKASPQGEAQIANENDIWLCNAQGVYNYKNASWVRISDSVQPDVLTLACQGENLWLGTFRGLVRINLSRNKSQKIDTTYPGEVTALSPHPQGVWAACGGQVGLAAEAGWIPLTEKRFNAPITSLLVGRDDKVWIGTHDGLLRGENKQILLHLTDNAPDVIGLASREKSPPTFSSLVQALSVQQFADRSILWIGTAQGLFRYDLFTESWRRYGQLASQDIRAIITSQDQETVWVASWSSGLHSLKQQNELQTAPNISEPILTLTAGSDRYWAVGLDGLYEYKDLAWIQVIPHTELPVRGWLQAIAQAVTDHVWLGTSAGLLLCKTDTKQLTSITGKLGSVDVRSLLAINRDESEQVWVGTSQGLYIGNIDNWEPIPDLENRIITALVWDRNNNSLWIGTDKGLFCWLSQGNSWKINEFNIHNSGLGANRVIALTISTGEDKETKLWIGTPSGLSCYTY